MARLNRAHVRIRAGGGRTSKRAPVHAESEALSASTTLESVPASLDTLYHRPGFLLRRAHQIAVSLFVEQPGADGTTTTQYGVLVILRACEGLDQISLSKKVGLDRSTTALVVKKLEDDGYVVRLADPKDRRRKVIVLTARGERKLQSLREVAARSQEVALSIFTAQEAAQFLALLAKFVMHFNKITRAPIVPDDSEI